MKQTGKGYNDIPRTADYAPPNTTRRWLDKWRNEGVLAIIEQELAAH